MKIELNLHYIIEIKGCKLNLIIGLFKQLLLKILDEVIKSVILKYAELEMNKPEKEFKCEKCGENHKLIWKTKHGRKTYITTEYGKSEIEQLQIQCKNCGHKFYITRKLLGVDKNKRISNETVKKLGLMGALASYRIIEKITGMFGNVINKMTIWNCVQKVGKEIKFDLDINELNEGEADGTGIAVHGAGKRGKELKIFTQRKRDGGIRIAGVSIGRYNGDWKKLFYPLKNSFKKFKEFLIVTDGDSEIIKGIGNNIKIKLQRCLWHMGHQIKYFLWKDKVKRLSADWIYILGKVISICTANGLAKQTAIESIPVIIKQRKKEWQDLKEFCKEKKYKYCYSYIENAENDLFTAIENKFIGRCTTLTERVMKTVNTRVNVGKWSDEGVLNTMKIRLSYYYNKFDI